jgi:two-component system, chemotaxis family, chemotaxis protein CheY
MATKKTLRETSLAAKRATGELDKSVSTPDTSGQKTVLIVDDSNSVRRAVKIALEMAGCEVLEGVDGIDGLSKLDGRRIHLIVSDLHMPNMDGLTFIGEAKKMERYRFTPMIMLTTETDETLKEKGRQIGMKAWLVKPFRPEVMLDVIKKFML